MKVKVAVPPAHIVVVPLKLAVGKGLTVTTALPVILAWGAVTLHNVAVLVTLTIVYVVFAVGVTLTVAPLLMPFALKLVVPSVYTTLYVPTAGNVKVKVAVPPAQIVVVPLIDAVGNGLTVRLTWLFIVAGEQNPSVARTTIKSPELKPVLGKVMTKGAVPPGNENKGVALPFLWIW